MNQLKRHRSRRDKIITIRPDSETMTRKGVSLFDGNSGTSTGARTLSMSMVIIPPGGSAIPNFHNGFKTSVYILPGSVETRLGEGLNQSVINEAGDFLFIPEILPHQPVNLSKTEFVKAIVARNDTNEQESVVIYKVSS